MRCSVLREVNSSSSITVAVEVLVVVIVGDKGYIVRES